MRLFVITDNPQDVYPNLRTWFPVEECECLVLGVKTKGLIIENFQLQTEIPDNLEEIEGYKWQLDGSADYPIMFELAGRPLLPKCIPNKRAMEDAKELNIALIAVFIIVALWLVFTTW